MIARWDYIAKKDKDKKHVDSGSDYQKFVNLELKTISKYENLKFKDSKLKEYAISYINEMNNGLKVAKTFGSESFDQKWYEHQNRRKELNC
ncbi:hypothetical protein MXZ84_10715 [Streptococcus uberis]|nr:hypothetical protein [Streptococcus uberis]MCK1203036.1 hypothetical protein [Streptococcus uberis]